MLNFLYKALSLKDNECKILILSLLFILTLFASYATLRPIRDALGIHNSDAALKWLFLGTFIATLFASFFATFLSGALRKKTYINSIYVFFALNLLLLFIALLFIDETSIYFTYLAYTFYIWLSVFNIFVISLAWSFLVDIFSQDRGQRLFGIICSGASLGSIIGAFLVSVFARIIAFHYFILFAFLLLIFAIFIKSLLLKESALLLENKAEKSSFLQSFSNTIGSKNPFSALIIILKSKYLIMFLCFILLSTSVATFLYMEQARIISANFTSKEARIAAFANIDLIVQISSFIMQIFFTARIAKFGLKYLLALLGFVIAFGFLILAFTHPAFLPFVLVMSIRRIGEYALIRPGREMLFVPLNSEEKYKVKNFLDTAVYRAGDAISAQVEGILIKFGVFATLLFGAFLSFLWGILGLFLAKGANKKTLQ